MWMCAKIHNYKGGGDKTTTQKKKSKVRVATTIHYITEMRGKKKNWQLGGVGWMRSSRVAYPHSVQKKKTKSTKSTLVRVRRWKKNHHGKEGKKQKRDLHERVLQIEDDKRRDKWVCIHITWGEIREMIGMIIIIKKGMRGDRWVFLLPHESVQFSFSLPHATIFKMYSRWGWCMWFYGGTQLFIHFEIQKVHCVCFTM